MLNLLQQTLNSLSRFLFYGHWNLILQSNWDTKRNKLKGDKQRLSCSSRSWLWYELRICNLLHNLSRGFGKIYLFICWLAGLICPQIMAIKGVVIVLKEIWRLNHQNFRFRLAVWLLQHWSVKLFTLRSFKTQNIVLCHWNNIYWFFCGDKHPKAAI